MTLEDLVQDEPAELTLQPSYKSVKGFVQDISKQVVRQEKSLQYVAKFSKMHYPNLKPDVEKSYETWMGYAKNNVNLLLDLYQDFMDEREGSKDGDLQSKPHPYPPESGVPERRDEWGQYQSRLGSMELTLQNIFHDIGVEGDDYTNRRFDVKVRDDKITGVIKGR